MNEDEFLKKLTNSWHDYIEKAILEGSAAPTHVTGETVLTRELFEKAVALLPPLDTPRPVSFWIISHTYQEEYFWRASFYRMFNALPSLPVTNPLNNPLYGIPVREWGEHLAAPDDKLQPPEVITREAGIYLEMSAGKHIKVVIVGSNDR